MRLKTVFCFLLIITLFLVPHTLSAQASVEEIIITQVEAGPEQFPEVTVRIRVLNSTGQPMTGLTLNSFAVTENGDNVRQLQGPREAADAGLWVHFVINAGSAMRGNALEDTKQSIRSFVTNQNLRQDSDRFALSFIEGNDLIPRVPFTTDHESIIQNVTNYTSPCTGSMCARPLASVPDLLLGDAWPDADRQPKIIIYFTGELEDWRLLNGQFVRDSDLENFGQQAQANNIAIYTVIVAGDVNGNQLADLAQQSGGAAVADSDLNALYQQIVAQYRPYYEISYRSNYHTTDNNAATRSIIIASVSGSISDRITYEVADIGEPAVIIDGPIEGAIISQAASANVQKVTAHVSFRGSYPGRRLASATLSVGTQAAEADRIDAPDPNSFEFPFPWSLITELGSTELIVTVTDELGFTTSRSVFVQAELPESTPTPLPTPAQVVVVNPDETPDTGTETGLPPLPPPQSPVMLYILVALLGLVMIVLVLGRNTAPVQQVRNTVMRGVDRLTKRYQRQSEVKAYMVVLEGDASQGKHLELYGTTTVGRSKEDAELVFQQYDESSPISRRHCTILDEEDHFKIRDEDSANGTYLNGVRLPPMEPRELFDGDEIELARVERGGVKVQFQSVQPRQEAMSEDEFRGTRVVKKRPSSGQSGDRF